MCSRLCWYSYCIQEARFTPSRVIPVGHSSKATSLNSQFRKTGMKLDAAPVRPTACHLHGRTQRTAASATIKPYRWRPQSPITAKDL